jgi:hypothetical protein
MLHRVSGRRQSRGHWLLVDNSPPLSLFRAGQIALASEPGNASTLLNVITAVTSVSRAVVGPRPDKWGDDCRTLTRPGRYPV